MENKRNLEGIRGTFTDVLESRRMGGKEIKNKDGEDLVDDRDLQVIGRD